MRHVIGTVVIASTVLAATTSGAVMLCAKKSGAVTLRESCKRKEAPVDVSRLGLLGPKGDPGEPGPFPGVLPSGKTVRGRYVIRFTAAAANDTSGDGISFGFQFASPPVPHFVALNDVPPPECPGSATSPAAQAGHLCVYESGQNNRHLVDIRDALAFSSAAETFGADIVLNSVASGACGSHGSWAATSP